MRPDEVRLSRRQAIAAGAIGALAAILAPRMALADQGSVAAELDRLFSGRAVAEGRVRLDISPTVEDGLAVPLTVDVESPMTEADHVRTLHVFADGNPLPQVVSYGFSPASGKASASTRIRLAQTQNVVCVAEMSDGRLFAAKAHVKVTIGGCGG